MCYSTPVFAKPTLDENGHLHVYNWDDIKDAAGEWIFQLACQIGAVVVDHDFSKYVQNQEAWVNYWKEENVSISEDGTKITFSQELMAYIKKCLDDYAKEHEPYYIAKTYSFDTADFSSLQNYRNVYNTLKNLLAESKSGFMVAGFSYDGGIWYADIDKNFADLSFIDTRGSKRPLGIYENETWKRLYWKVYYVKLSPNDDDIKTAAEFKEKAINTFSGTSWEYGLTQEAMAMLPTDSYQWHYSNYTIYSWLELVSKETRRVRVFNTFADFQNYTLGKRSVYYTENYYNYVPEDLTVTIDDLEKAVDDLQKVIDELLKQIQDDTSEKEIEDLLRQILEELRNGQGTGGGGGGGGDVTVDIDLTQTNSWLAKIYAKVSQIFDKLNAAVEDAESAAMAKIQESLDEIISQLKKIKRWTAIDTVIDGVDAIADWLDLIKDVLTDAKEGAGSAVAAIAGTVGDSVDMMSQKFPFSVPWDILFFISVMSAEPQMPHFEIPFNIELSMLDITIDYTMELDFEQLQWLSDLSRLLLSMTYAVGLLKMTAGITSVGKEG